MTEPGDPRADLDRVRRDKDLTRLPLPARQSPEAAAAQQASVKAIERLLNLTAHVAPAVAANTPQATLVGFTTEGAEFIKRHLTPLMTTLSLFVQRVMVESGQYDEGMWREISAMMRAAADAGDDVESFVFNSPLIPLQDAAASFGITLDELGEDEEDQPGGRGRQQRPPADEQ